MYYFFLKPELTSQYPLPASSKSGAAPAAKSSKQAGVKPPAPAPAPASPK
jgi:hypothetical protein